MKTPDPHHGLCLVPIVCFLFGCNSTSKPDYKTVKLESPIVIDCKGKEYNNGKITELQILSSNVTIKDCKINGSVRTIGLGRNGEAAGVKASSFELGHTERAQAAAPKNTVLSNVTITGHGRIPIYLGPGTTEFTLRDSTIKGHSESVALYLDAESGNNTIRGNTFRIAEATREIIAVDGSANNQITSNTINRATKGGIYLYRNCGEGGTVRHQAPRYNIITDNTIDNVGGYGIWLGSRNGNRSYCKDDSGFPFGSSKDDGDFADNNIVKNNVFTHNDRAIAPSPK
jgi:parallel beta-helix repeat protein